MNNTNIIMMISFYVAIKNSILNRDKPIRTFGRKPILRPYGKI